MSCKWNVLLSNCLTDEMSCWWTVIASLNWLSIWTNWWHASAHKRPKNLGLSLSFFLAFPLSLSLSISYFTLSLSLFISLSCIPFPSLFVSLSYILSLSISLLFHSYFLFFSLSVWQSFSRTQKHMQKEKDKNEIDKGFFRLKWSGVQIDEYPVGGTLCWLSTFITLSFSPSINILLSLSIPYVFCFYFISSHFSFRYLFQSIFFISF